jgi:8-oxo-dGTP diphosphatase
LANVFAFLQKLNGEGVKHFHPMKFLLLALRLCLAFFQRMSYFLTLGMLPPFVSAVVIVREGEKILMLERGDGRGYGLPGGYLKLHETAEAAAQRETLEETGLQVELLRVLGTLSGKRPRIWVSTVDIVFEGRVLGGELRPSPEGRPCWVNLEEVRSRVAFDYLKILEGG